MRLRSGIRRKIWVVFVLQIAAISFATIVGVYPANISMALEAGRPRSLATLAPWLRLPLQFPMIAWAWRHAKGPDLAR